MSIWKAGDDLYLELKDCSGEKRDIEPLFAEISQIMAKYGFKIAMLANLAGMMAYMKGMADFLEKAEGEKSDEEPKNS